MKALKRLSLNQATIRQWGVKEVVEGCAASGVGFVGLWREPVAAHGLEATARLLRDTGVQVSSLCRGGFFPAPTRLERRRRIAENHRAVDEAAALGTDILVLVCGGLPEGSRDLDGARQMVADGIAEVLPYAAAKNVKLAVEPLHPMYTADRSVICSLKQANDLAARFASEWLGVVIDVYHVWWDPCAEQEIARAKKKTLGFHVCDWLVPTPDMLNGRGMMGDGVIDLVGLRERVEKAGYRGPIEVEIFNESLWALPADELLQLVKTRFKEHVMGK